MRRPPSNVLGTLPLKAKGSPVSHARMMSAPYSTLGAVVTAPPPSSRARSVSHSAICASQRRGYSSSGMLKRSMRSGRAALMNHGTYSAKCSEDSVTK